MSDVPKGAAPQRPPHGTAHSARPPALPAYPQARPGGRAPVQPHPWTPPPPPPPPQWIIDSRVKAPSAVPAAVLWIAVCTGLVAAVLLRDGIGVNLLLTALPAALAAAVAAVVRGRRPRAWTLVWAVTALGLLLVPALRDAGWPAFLAVLAFFAVGSLALHGGRRWPGVLLGSLGVWASVVPGTGWAMRGLRERTAGNRQRWLPMAKAVVVAVVLLVVFGALFAGADAAFADLLSGIVPDMTLGDFPLRVVMFALGLLGALAAAYTAAAPRRFDRVKVRPGRARGRAEWALPLVVLAVLFAVFNAVQLTVLFGGYQKVLAETGLTYAQYARQGFWQLLIVTLLTIAVIGLALRWAPRGGDGDRLLVRSVLGAICVLTLVVVASALRRMELYVGAYGLTRMRISVAGVELWLGLLIVLIMAAGVLGARWLPRAVVASAAVGFLVFGLSGPDALIAEQQVTRYENTGRIDLVYLQDLSADAVPALDRLPEPQRSCALQTLAHDLRGGGDPWYARSLGESRARSVLAARPVDPSDACSRAGLDGYRIEVP
ncbi:MULTISPECIES: DUF4153 domain-containing protein [unclassified Streptomyces]|uniref:DUF4153 domain-containing protein n=1 Tax=unclassified Streptomyces TaxID=2593676 RepID=UPI0037FFEC76